VEFRGLHQGHNSQINGLDHLGFRELLASEEPAVLLLLHAPHLLTYMSPRWDLQTLE